MSTRAEARPFPFATNGAKIRGFRKRVGKSQERLAVEIGTTRRHMIRLENGEHLPGRDLRDRIAAATGRGPEEIQSADDEEDDSMPRRFLSDDLLRLARVQALLERNPSAVDHLLEKQSPPRELTLVTGTGSNHEGA